MARMIPPGVGEDAPPGERDVFVGLRDAKGTESWVAFHSLNIAHHESQVEGEADFVVLIPGSGVLVIEVKSHERIEADGHGMWRFGNGDWQSRSPFDQASGAMHSIREFLVGRGMSLIGFPIWYAVWFTAVSKEHMPSGIGWQSWATLGAADLSAPNMPHRVAAVLSKAAAHMQEKGLQHIAGLPTADDVARIVEALEPHFRLELSAAERARRRDCEIRKFTTEQLRVLDAVDEAPRLLIDGPAGSGKTFLVIEAARRASFGGGRVLVIVYNRLLEEDLRTQLAGIDNIEVFRIHALMMKVAGLEEPPNASPDWYTNTLPQAALDATLAEDFTAPYDVLVVDEAQDVAAESSLDFLDQMLSGGLERGTAIVAGDFANQSIYEDGDTKAKWRPRMPDASLVRVKVNCRNLPDLGRYFADFTGKAALYSEYRRPESGTECVTVCQYAAPSEQAELVASAVERLLAEQFTVRDIVILSPIRNSAARSLLGKLPRLGANIRDPQLIRWGTIHEFKGLEAPAVILTDIASDNRHLADLLYVGMTRATDRLVLLTDKSELAESPRH